MQRSHGSTYISAAMRLGLLCALICVLSYVCSYVPYLLSYVCSHDTVSFSQFHLPHCLGSLARKYFIFLNLLTRRGAHWRCGRTLPRSSVSISIHIHVPQLSCLVSFFDHMAQRQQNFKQTPAEMLTKTIKNHPSHSKTSLMPTWFRMLLLTRP